MDRKTAFVTGGSKVTGKCIALRFGEAGYDVGITYLNDAEGALDTVEQIKKNGMRAKAYHADTRDIERVRNVFNDFTADFLRFDVLVNNVGITQLQPFLDISEKTFDEVINTNLKGTFFTTQSAAKIMKELGNGGVILNMSSVHAHGTWPGDTIYATTKAGINRMTEAMALDLAEDGIRVVCVAPGYIAMGHEKSHYNTERYNAILRRIPMHRFAHAGEIGDVCVFLASEKASYITGTTLYVEGGVMLPVVTENTYV